MAQILPAQKEPPRHPELLSTVLNDEPEDTAALHPPPAARLPRGAALRWMLAAAILVWAVLIVLFLHFF